MSTIVRGSAAIIFFVLIATSPLWLGVVDVARSERGTLTEFSAAMGFVGVMLIGLEFVLIAKFRTAIEPFGTPALFQLHRNMGMLGIGMVAAHVAISATWDSVTSLFDPGSPWRVRFGVAAALTLTVLVVTSVWRTRMRLSYEQWHRLHAVLAVTTFATAMIHAALVDFYIDTWWQRLGWVIFGGLVLATLIWVRLIRPARLRHWQWTVERTSQLHDDVVGLELRPIDHEGMSFAPGQYGWFTVDGSRFAMTKHPFSFSSSAERPERLEIAVKALGDFTSSLSEVVPGTKVVVDGPYGVFTPDRHQGEGFCFIAGGIGITPVMSMLRTFADRGDRRPLVAIIANGRSDHITFRDELGGLAERLDLDVVHVVEEPDDDWDGPVGFVDAEVLSNHLPADHRRWRFFICGPDPMMDAVEEHLGSLGVDAAHMHSERFGWV